MHAGDLIKLGFGLNGNHGLSILAGGSPGSVQVPCPSDAVLGLGSRRGHAQRALLRRRLLATTPTAGRPTRAWAGTCRQFSLQLNDGTPAHTAVFEFFA